MDFSGGTFSFGTGVQSLTWNGSSYTYNGDTSIEVPVSISYSLVTGGQTFSGTDENLDLYYYLSLGDQLSTANYPESISTSPSSTWFYQYSAVTETTMASFTATDGFQGDLLATTTSVPEPSSWAILGCALVAIKLIKQRQS
jgi:hypothetical protein